VARYFFDVQDGKPLVRDNDGAEFDTLDSAPCRRRPALQRVCTVTASLRIERHGLSLQRPHSCSA
jgi:hypothetical protein